MSLSLPGANTQRALVVSSGIHGVEGFLGSAIQCCLLEEWAHAPPPIRCVLLHALNPFGFAWRRRVNETNVDLNRNLLLEGEPFSGSPSVYAELDGLLNPKRGPSRWKPLTPQLLAALARYGMPRLKQALATGQYDYPLGLFYGGDRPSRTSEILSTHFDRWLGSAGQVMHLDFHTGLGDWATFKLLVDQRLSTAQSKRLSDWFGSGSFEVVSAEGVAYTARGTLGQWCVAHNPTRDYVYAAAEFGTYRLVQVLAGLREENQAHHWCDPGDAAVERSKAAAGGTVLPTLRAVAKQCSRGRTANRRPGDCRAVKHSHGGNDMTQQHRALVIGGSLGGLFAAHLLRNDGWKVDVFERVPDELAGRGAGIVTHPELFDALVRCGVEIDASIGVEVPGRVTLDAAGRTIGEFALKQVLTSWGRLYAALKDRFPTEAYHQGFSLERVEQSGGQRGSLFRERTASARRSAGRRRRHSLHGSRPVDALRRTAVRRLCGLARPRGRGGDLIARRMPSCSSGSPSACRPESRCWVTRWQAPGIRLSRAGGATTWCGIGRQPRIPGWSTCSPMRAGIGTRFPYRLR